MICRRREAHIGASSIHTAQVRCGTCFKRLACHFSLLTQFTDSVLPPGRQHRLEGYFKCGTSMSTTRDKSLIGTCGEERFTTAQAKVLRARPAPTRRCAACGATMVGYLQSQKAADQTLRATDHGPAPGSWIKQLVGRSGKIRIQQGDRSLWFQQAPRPGFTKATVSAWHAGEFFVARRQPTPLNMPLHQSLTEGQFTRRSVSHISSPASCAHGVQRSRLPTNYRPTPSLPMTA